VLVHSEKKDGGNSGQTMGHAGGTYKQQNLSPKVIDGVYARAFLEGQTHGGPIVQLPV
jgi:hypothetical protein